MKGNSTDPVLRPQASPVEIAFDYDAYEIKKTEQRVLESRANRITSKVENVRRTTVESVFEIAVELQGAYDEMANYKNGTFGKWVEQRCGIAPRTAQVMLRAYRELSNEKYRATVAQYFDPTAMYLLTAESCPEEVTQKAIALAKKGEHITAKRAKELIGKQPKETEASHLDKFRSIWSKADAMGKATIRAFVLEDVTDVQWDESAASEELVAWFTKWTNVVTIQEQSEVLAAMVSDIARNAKTYRDDWRKHVTPAG